MIQTDAPMKVYAEQQLSSCGWFIAEIDIAKAARPTLFLEYRGDDVAVCERLIEDAKRNGQLYNAVIKVGKPGDTTKTVVDTLGLVHRVTPEDRRAVSVIARSKARLSERMAWHGLNVESVTPWREPVPEPEPDQEEVAAREAEQQALYQTMGLYRGHPERKAVED